MFLQKSVFLAGILMLLGCTSVQPVVAELNDEKQLAAHYQFSILQLSAKDSRARYQVRVGIPNRASPTSGYAVLYMLDGEAALAAFKEQNFSALGEGDWPVIVTLGHKGAPRTQQVQAARAYDYTPAAVVKPDTLIEAQYGGAEAFGQFIEQEVKPAVAQRVKQRVKLDSRRQALWGHSFGGLFVLHTLFNHPASFQTYVVADASLWWQQGQILEAEARYREKYRGLGTRPQAQLLMLRSASHRTDSVLAEDASRQLAKRLSQLPELTVHYYDYFQHHHGSIRGASLPAALRMAQGIEQQ